MNIPFILFFFIFISLSTTQTASIFAADGESAYRLYCSSCHGTLGRGGKALPLNKEGLLVTVENSYFEKTAAYGRPMSGCPPQEKKISPEGRKALAAFIKSWQKGPMLEAPEHEVIPSDNEKGRELFPLCGGCHGLMGEGAMGPPILDPGLLKSISDAELRRTIIHGRPGTPMRGFTKGKGGLAVLEANEIDDLISYIRFRQKEAERRN